ncbi:MAG: pantoate--beta-alanine ligase, partial [bacterium]|nr:pantoate--beta-alanine ligase [bacterium]
MINGIDGVKNIVASAKQRNENVGLVPTMGGLHEGHLSLIRRADNENEKVIVTVFVNPKQFGPEEDLDRYPRDLDRDMSLADEAGADVVFAPDANVIYPEGFSTYVNVEGLTDLLCGASRPGHFRGVITVCVKLFSIVRADRTYFGEKDAQQLRIIKRVVRDLNIPIEVVACPIIREPDGLAMSSRNVYLSPEQREGAVCLYNALLKAESLYDSGTRESGTIIREIEAVISGVPEAEIDYISIVDNDS